MAFPKRTIAGLACLLLGAMAAIAQTDGPAAPTPDPAYVLGPGDQVSVAIEDLSEPFAGKSFRIDTSGDLSLPVIGHIQAAGLTVATLESATKARLTHVLKDPQVTISLVNFGSQPISILGAVNSPGIRQLEGRKTLFEVLSASGGLRADAGYQVKITRDLKFGPIPVPQAETDSASRTSVASINVSDIINATNPAANIAIFPGDAISVPRADLVYVIGSVNRSGGFALNEHSSITILQAIALAEGLQKTAGSERARILRLTPGSTVRAEIPINLKKLLDGKIGDTSLVPNDILFVPNSGAKVAEQRTIDILAGAAGAAIWRF